MHDKACSRYYLAILAPKLFKTYHVGFFFALELLVTSRAPFFHTIRHSNKALTCTA